MAAPRGIQVVLYDAVGTLIAPSPPAERAYWETARRFGSRLSLEQVRRRLRRALERPAPQSTSEAVERAYWQTTVALVFPEIEAAAGPLFEALWEHFAQAASWQVYPDVHGCWKTLQRAGLQQGVASNFDQRLVTIASELPPLEHAQWVFTSAELGFRKPSVHFYDAIRRKIGLDPSQYLMVGDDYTRDVQAARQAGWQAVWLRRSDSDTRCDATIDRLDQLPCWLGLE